MMNEKPGMVERTKLFALRIVRLYSSLPESTEAMAAITVERMKENL